MSFLKGFGVLLLGLLATGAFVRALEVWPKASVVGGLLLLALMLGSRALRFFSAHDPITLSANARRSRLFD